MTMDTAKTLDVISALENMSIGIMFGQLCHGDAASTWKELDREVGKGELKLGALEKKGKKNTPSFEKKCLAVAIVSIHDTKLCAQLTSRASRNVLYLVVVKRL